ncbi:MAG: undecaprenyl-phosphate glucose phosphotransferase [Ferruginibacter sp.]|nr:undecaprenyl-phosphate glucose phosphotransferase [Cytophagales bacterium]
MPTRYTKFTRAIYLTGDVLLVNASFGLAYYLKFGNVAFSQPYYDLLAVYFNLTWIAATFVLEIYHIERVEQNSAIVRNTLRILFLHALLIAAFVVVRKGYYYSREQLLTTYALLAGLVIGWRFACVYFFRFYRTKGYNYRNVIILGSSEAGRSLRDFFCTHPEHGYVFLGFFCDRRWSSEVEGSIADAQQFILDHQVDEVYCSLSDVQNHQVSELIQFADNNLVHVKILPDLREIAHKNVKVDLYGTTPVLSFREIPLDDVLNKFIKRAFDIVFSLLIIVGVLSWLLPLVAVTIKITSRGPVFFKQLRSGKNNQSFWCWKFRSMYVNQESHIRQATRHDSRITPIGRMLRKTNVDELPQFFNVLIGNMSVVGPRPHMLRHTEEYSRSINKYMVRHFVKPGITGLAQAKGYRGDTSNPQLMRNRVKVDTFYIENWSILLDLKIIALTVFSMLNGNKNAY